MEKIMKTRRLKPFLFVIALYLIPIGMVSTALTTPVFANETNLSEEQVSNTPATIPQDAEEGKTWEETHNHGSNDKNTTIRFKLGEDEGTSEEHVFISIDGVDKDITAISTIFNKLIETEWDDLDDAEKEEILETLKEIEAGIEVEVDVDVDSSGPSATEAIIAIVAIMFTIGSPILIIGTILYYKHRKRRLEAEDIHEPLARGGASGQRVIHALDRGRPAAPPALHHHQHQLQTFVLHEGAFVISLHRRGDQGVEDVLQNFPLALVRRVLPFERRHGP